jgi:hypothetical protein
VTRPSGICVAEGRAQGGGGAHPPAGRQLLLLLLFAHANCQNVLAIASIGRGRGGGEGPPGKLGLGALGEEKIERNKPNAQRRFAKSGDPPSRQHVITAISTARAGSSN